jgi:hypothetical protein
LGGAGLSPPEDPANTLRPSGSFTRRALMRRSLLADREHKAGAKTNDEASQIPASRAFHRDPPLRQAGAHGEIHRGHDTKLRDPGCHEYRR